MAPSETPLIASVCTECGASLEFELGTMQVRCDHCDAGLAIDPDLRLVRLNCPACSGNFYYIDGAMCGHCPYCDTALLALSQHRLLRYMIQAAAEPPDEAQDAELILLPFWHLSGLIYGFDVGNRVEIEQAEPVGSNPEYSPSVIRSETGLTKTFRGRIVNLTIPDPAALSLGVTSLRLRAAIHALEPLGPEDQLPGRLVPATADLTEIRDQLRARAFGYQGPTEGMNRLECQRKDLVSESLALTYYPFWVKDQPGGTSEIWDGVTGHPERLATPTSQTQVGPTAAFDELKIIELRCDTCGAGLPPGNHSVVLPCPGCGEFWLVTRQGLESFTASFALPPDGGQKIAWLPFWHMQIKLRYGGKEATRVADIRNVLGIMRPGSTLPTAEADHPLGLYVPAFGAIKAPRMDYAARDMTRLQPKLVAGPKGEGELFTCFFGPEDAQQLAYVSWIPILPGVVLQRLRSLRVETTAPELWYIPFEDHGRELENLLTGMRYDWTAFRGVRH